MSDNNKKQLAEKISAYLDDVLSVEEIDALIAQNQSLEPAGGNFSTAARYHLIGEALRGELSDASMVDVSIQVRKALQSEPSHIAAPVPVAKKSSFSENLFAWLDSFARPLAGMAVAASVAVLMVVTVVQLEAPVGGQQLANSPAPAPTALIAGKQPVQDSSDKKQQMAEFDRYLAEHAEFAAQDTLQSRLPYVRAVSYEAE